ncbi:MAG: hypothetical protein JSS66_00810 [Armatimonadetes bacterium]|nr:hypothetical protein [Armatimonadota bacterium]
MYEHRSKPPLTQVEFRGRVVRHALAALAVLLGALSIGVLGYRLLGGLPWIDAVLNASMILGGMGPVNELHSDAAKLFASVYAVFSGVVFIGVAGVTLAPFAHRVLHLFHWDEGKD